PGQELERVDRERRLPPARLGRTARDADDVAEVHVDLPGPVERAEELDAAGAVDEVEERQLPHVAPGEDASREAARRFRLAARPDSSGSAAARTTAISSRSGNRLGRSSTASA